MHGEPDHFFRKSLTLYSDCIHSIFSIQEKQIFRPNGASTFPLSLYGLIISNILTFSYTLLSVRRPPKTTSVIPTYHGNSMKRFHLKLTAKNPIQTIQISSLVDTDLDSLNGSSLFSKNDCLSINNTYLHLSKFTCSIAEKTKTYFQTFFSNIKVWLVQVKEGFRYRQ